MATRLFPRASASDSASTRFPFAPSTRVDGSGESQWVVSPLMDSQGSAVQNHTISTVSGPTAGVQDTVPIFWISAPIDRDITIASAITLNLRAEESSMNANAAINARIYRIQPDGTFSVIATTARTTELGTSEAAANFTVAPTSTDFNKGDRIGVAPFIDDSTANMGSGFSVTLFYAGAAGATGDTYIEFAEDFLMLDTDPATTTIYPTNTASAVATASNDLEAWTSRGAGVQSAVTNSTAGPTSGVHVTGSAGGTVIDWFTKPLAALTLAAPVLVNTRYLVSSIGAVAIVRCEIARVDGDGTNPVVWGTGGYAPGPSGTTEVGVSFYVAGDDLSITDGQRLRIRFYLDDDPEFGNMASGHTVTFRYAGTSGGASGDSFLIFDQTLTEFTGGNTVTGSFTADSVLRKNQTGSIATNAVIRAPAAGSLTIDSILRRTQAASLTADAIVRKNQTGSFSLNAVIRRTITGFSILDVGHPPGVVSDSIGEDISDDARFVAVFDFTNSLGYRWGPSGFTALGTLGGSTSLPLGIGSDGSVVVGGSETPTPGEIHAFRWASGSMVDLGALGPGENSEARGVSGDGSVVVGRSTVATQSGYRAFRWTQAGGMVSLGSIGTNTDSEAWATDSDGSVVVGSSYTDANVEHPFRWTQADGMVDLGLPFGDDEAYAFGVSPDGSVVVGESYSQTTGRFRGWRWTSGTGFVELSLDGIAVGVTDSSIAVGDWSNDGGDRGARWDAGTLDLMPSLGGDSHVKAITPDGKYMAGSALTLTETHPAIWTQGFTADATLRVARSGSLTLDAFLNVPRTGSITADAVIRAPQVGGFSADSILRREQLASLTADAIVRKEQAGSFITDAVLRAVGSAAFTTDAVLRGEQGAAFTVDAALKATVGASFTLDAWIAGGGTGALTADAVIRRTQTGEFAIEAIVNRTASAIFTADAVLRASQIGAITADAVVRKTVLGALTADAVILQPRMAGFTVDAILRSLGTGSLTLDAVTRTVRVGVLTADATVQRTQSATFTADAVLRRAQTGFLTLDAVIAAAGAVTGSFVVDAVIRRSQEQAFTADAVVRIARAGSFVADALLRRVATGEITADAVVRRTQQASFTADSVVRSERIGAVALDAIIRIGRAGSLTLDAEIVPVTIIPGTGSFTLNAVIRGVHPPVSADIEAATWSADIARDETDLVSADIETESWSSEDEAGGIPLSDVSFTEGDSFPPIIGTIKNTAKTAAIDLSDVVEVRFQMRRVGDKRYTVDAVAEITDAAAGMVSYAWANNDLDRSGDYEVQWELHRDDGSVTTTRPPNTLTVDEQ